MSATTRAEYTAWLRGWMVAHENLEVRDGTSWFGLTLESVAEIDEVVVEVCWPPDIQDLDESIPDRCFSGSYPITRNRAAGAPQIR
jgi:hypothetical protein